MKQINELLSHIRYKQLFPVFESLRTKQYAVIKGEPLSKLAYGECGKRHLGDIDILIDRKDIFLINKILLSNGFKTAQISRSDKVMMLSFSHQIAPYSKKISPFGNIMIDVNFDIFWGEYDGKRIDITDFLSDVVYQKVYEYDIKTLNPMKALVQLILHTYKDMNSIYILSTRGKYYLGSLNDVFFLLKRNYNAIPLVRLYEISDEYNIIPYVYYVLYHVHLFHKDIIIDQYLKAFESFEGKRLLNCYGLNETERREWKVDLHTRLRSKNLYCIMKNDLSEKDRKKIELNRRVF